MMKPGEIAAARRIVDAIDKSQCAEWFKTARTKTEQPIYWDDEESGLKCRAQLDMIIPDCGREEVFTFFADLKITINWRPEDFKTYLSGHRRSSMRGWMQAAHYKAGLQSVYETAVMMVFVCANPDPPHQVVTNRIRPEDMDLFSAEYRKTLNELGRRYRENDWADSWETEDNTPVMDQWEIC